MRSLAAGEGRRRNVRRLAAQGDAVVIVGKGTDDPRLGYALASAAATRGLSMLAAYCAAKAGVARLIRALAVELRGTSVTANAVSPGSTDTAMLSETARLHDLVAVGAFVRQQPIERLIEPDEIAAAISSIAGPEAGAITGANHTVDGGLTI